MFLSRYLKIWPDPPAHLILYSTRRAAILRVPKIIMKQIANGTLSANNRETLARYGMLVPDPALERDEMLHRFYEANRRTKRFRAIVVLSLDCNLACGYCFEEGVRGKQAMTAETAGLMVEMIEREQIAKERKVSIDFYGGEPLLSRDLLRSISASLRKSSEEKGVPFEFYLVTNGTLISRRLVLELKEFGMKGAKITLDGPRHVHDRSRPFISGKGSFDLIIRNILDIMDATNVQIGGNFTKENYREFPRLLDYFISVGITPDKVEVVQFNPVIGRIGGATPDFASTCNCTTDEWLCEATIFLREEILARSFNTPKPGPAGCMVEFANDLVVNVDGTIYKCPVFVGRKGFAVGNLRDGLRDDGSVYNRNGWKNEECLECPYLPQCFGGCRFMKYMRDGAISGVDCWKEFFDATLEKLVRQDLKYRPANRQD